MDDRIAIPDWLSRRAADTPDQPALIAGSLRWTWRDLHRRAAALAVSVAGMGIAPGDRVAALLANAEQYVEVVHALIQLRAVLVPLNIRLTPEEMVWQAWNSRARVLLHDAAAAGQAGALRQALPALPQHALAFSGIEPAAASIAEPARIDLWAIHGIIYTSGTSGRPKGAMLSYGNHWWNAVGSALNLGLHSDDRWLACLPFYHVGGLSILMRGVIYGIPVVLPNAASRQATAAGGFDPAQVNRAIDEDGVTIVSVVGTMLSRMLEQRGSQPYPAALRCVLLGGGPAPRPLLEECARRGIPVTQTYGLTETSSQFATLAPADALRKLGSAGRALLPNELRILPLPRDGETLGETASAGDDAPASRPVSLRGTSRSESPPSRGRQPALLAAGMDTGSTHANERSSCDRDRESDQHPSSPPIGEILVRGPSVTAGYVLDDGNLDVLRPATDAEGWLHTGDLGYLDSEGYLYVLDRRADLVVTGGENVYPAEVEAVLHAHPTVAEAAVYGIADDVWGQCVAAAIVARPGARTDEAEILAFCRERLASYKVPSMIRIIDALPRSAAGKLVRRRLLDI